LFLTDIALLLNYKSFTMIIEIAVFNLESAIMAFEAGAHRIELCSSPAEGGLTPSAATMRLAVKYVKIPVHVMIRPREGDFCYSAKEFETMLLDVAAAKIAGMKGVVTGILNPDGTVDEDRMSVFVKAASPMNVTFHRAFDMVADQDKELETIIRSGCVRILTSGGKPTAPEGIDAISNIIIKANGRITIMPGSGVNMNNIRYLAEMSGATEMHLSARKLVSGKMNFRNSVVTMGGNVTIPDYDLQMPDQKMILEIVGLFG
jgi:copper homeostasis protein